MDDPTGPPADRYYERVSLPPEDVALLQDHGFIVHRGGCFHRVRPWYSPTWVCRTSLVYRVIQLIRADPGRLLALDAAARLGGVEEARRDFWQLLYPGGT